MRLCPFYPVNGTINNLEIINEKFSSEPDNMILFLSENFNRANIEFNKTKIYRSK